MYQIINPHELTRLKGKLTAKDFSCRVDPNQFNVRIIDVETNTNLKFKLACKVINSILGTTYSLPSGVIASAAYPCFRYDSPNRISEGTSVMFIDVVLHVKYRAFEPLVTLDALYNK